MKKLFYIIMLLEIFTCKSYAQTRIPINGYSVLAKKTRIYVQPYQINGKLFNTGDRNYIISSSKNIYIDKIISLDLDNDGKKETISLGNGHPNGILILAKKGRYYVDLMKEIYNSEDTAGINKFFDNTYGLKEDCLIQVSCFDLDGDSKKEVIVSIGNADEITMKSYIFKIRNAEEASFKYVGCIEGMYYMFINRNRHIIAPQSVLRWYDEYVYTSGTIFKALKSVDIDTLEELTQ